MKPNADLTIEDVLADPLIGAVMKADRVDPKALESMLRALAPHFAGAFPKTPFIQAGTRDAELAADQQLSDCCHFLAQSFANSPPAAARGGRQICGTFQPW